MRDCGSSLLFAASRASREMPVLCDMSHSVSSSRTTTVTAITSLVFFAAQGGGRRTNGGRDGREDLVDGREGGNVRGQKGKVI